MIDTVRFRLLPCEPRHLSAFQLGRDALAQELGCRLPEGWPEFPEAFAAPPAETPADAASRGSERHDRGDEADARRWGGYLFVDPAAGTLVGNGGFRGPPDRDGLVEVGYEIAPGFRNRGYATEIVRALVDFALADARVQVVQAHTLAEVNASNRVLARLGLRKVAEFDDPEEGRLWCWQRRRDDGRARGGGTRRRR